MSEKFRPICARSDTQTFMANPSMQKISFMIPLADYGWLMRYSEQNDISLSQLARKAIRFYITAIEQKKKKEQETKANE